MIVEDGTGLTGAQSYISIEFADIYHTLRANSVWVNLTDEALKVAALVKATDYVDRRWRDQFIGDPLTTTQALAFPRTELGLPVAFKNAIAEYALREVESPLVPDPDMGEGAIIKRREKVGPIEEEIEYGRNGINSSPFKSYPQADMLLTPYIQETIGVYR